MSSIANTIPVSALLQSTAAPRLQVPELGLLPTTGASRSFSATPFNAGLASSLQTGASSDMMNQMAGMMSAMFQMFMQQMMSQSGAGNVIPTSIGASATGFAASPAAANGFSLSGRIPSMTSSLLNIANLSAPSTSLSSFLPNGSAGLSGNTGLSASAGSLGNVLGSASTPGTSVLSTGSSQGSGAGAARIGYDPDGATAKPGIVSAANSQVQIQTAKNASNALGQQISNISAGLNTTSAVNSSQLGASLGLPATASSVASPVAITSAGTAASTAAAKTATPTTGLSAAAAPAPSSTTSTTSNPGLTSLITSIIDVCKKLIAACGGAPATASAPASGTAASTAGAATAGTATTTAPARTQFNQEDAKNYILGSSRGGTIVQEPSISANYSDRNSRFYKIGDSNEFDAVVQKIYSAQFAGYAKGLDIVYNPGTDNINTISANIVKAQDAYNSLNDDARLFADVAATYRGDFGNRGAYNNPALKQLLVSWGRTDLANAPLVGDPSADAQSIGAVTQALNEQTDPVLRKQWLQQIFDFQNNTPNSPSGAVPDVANYQKAIAIVKSGTLEKLMQNYVNGIKTTGPVI